MADLQGGAGEGNRTPVVSLGRLGRVGEMADFSQSECSPELEQAPNETGIAAAITAALPQGTAARREIPASPILSNFMGTNAIAVTPGIVRSFWGRVKILGDNECWLWTGHIERNGYASMHPIKGASPIRANRVSYVIHHGPIAPRMMICHHCDNRRCVNPRHLYQGTAKQNAEDTSARGRARSGKAKLTEPQVRAIISLFSNGASNSEIAKRYGVHASTINNIRQQRSWRRIWTEIERLSHPIAIGKRG